MSTASNSANQGKPADATMVPVFYSIVVYPGIGQWMQKRQAFALFYGIVFFLFASIFAWIFYTYLRQVIPIIQDALAGTSPAEERTLPPLSTILKPFAALMIIYFANVMDVIRARMKLKT